MPNSDHNHPNRRLQTAFQLILYHITTGPWQPNEYKMLMVAWNTLQAPLLQGTSQSITDIEQLAEAASDVLAGNEP